MAFTKVAAAGIESTGTVTLENLVVTGGTTALPSISPNGDPNTGIFFPSPDTIAIGEGGTEVIRVDSSGRVGVGTTNPQTKLHIDGHLRLDSSGYSVIILGDNSSNSFHITKEISDNSFNVWSGALGSGTSRFKIDSSGRMTTPNQPAFWITNFSWSTSIQRPHSASLVFTNVGSHFNNTNGIFTAPVEGYYLFICTVQGHNPSETAGRNATYYNLVATKNNVDLGNEIVATANDIGGKHDHITHQVIVNLAANDIFYFRSNYGYRTVQNSYCGYLLG